MKTIRAILLICGASVCVFPFAASLCVPAQAEVITVTISGTGSGTLGGNAFTDQPFEWALTYDTANIYSPKDPAYDPVLGPNQSLFLNPVSAITLGGNPTPINITQEQGVYFDSNSGLYLSPVTMVLNPITQIQNPASNILTITGDPAWSGLSGPYPTSSSSISGSDFSQFTDISTDQGALTMSAPTADDPAGSTVSSVTATPEPSALALLAVAGAGLALIGRPRKHLIG